MEEVVWQQWLAERSEKNLWQLVDHYTLFSEDVARFMFKQLSSYGVDLDDLKQTAILGLIDAIKGYKQNMGASFQHYARFRIRGAILNSLPKSSERQSLQAYYKRLEAQRKKSLNNKGVHNLESLANLIVNLSYSYLLDDFENVSEKNTSPTPYEYCHIEKLKKRLYQVVAMLPEQQQQLVRLHYIEHESFEFIAESWQLSKGRISQIHKKTIETLRKILREQDIVQGYL